MPLNLRMLRAAQRARLAVVTVAAIGALAVPVAIALRPHAEAMRMEKELAIAAARFPVHCTAERRARVTPALCRKM